VKELVVEKAPETTPEPTPKTITSSSAEIPQGTGRYAYLGDVAISSGLLEEVIQKNANLEITQTGSKNEDKKE
jgi:hypothetical protein